MTDSNIVEGLRPLAVLVESLVPDAANAKIHDQRSIDSIAAALVQFGQHRPLVVQKHGAVVRVGNGTLAAARKLGWTEIAAVFVDETNVEAAARAIADNRLSELSKFDDRALGHLLASIGDEAPELLEATGFTDSEAEDLIAPLAAEEPMLGMPEDAREGIPASERSIGQGGEPPPYTRLIQLFFGEAGFIEFGKLVDRAKMILGAPTISDTVIGALRRAIARPSSS